MADPLNLSRPLGIHVVGVGGAGMSPIAEVLATMGHRVSVSDQRASPVLDRLRAAGVDARAGHDAAHVGEGVEAVAISTAVGRDNAEVQAAHQRGIPVLRRADVLAALTRLRRTIAVAGTHGKTTTSALLAHVLVAAGRDPSFLVGGVTRNYAASFRLGGGPHVVIEGDEYDTAYFDKGPKFLHYRPRTAILTSIEFDHADIYRDLAHYRAAFEAFARILPADGFLAVSAAYPDAVAIARTSAARVVSYAAAPASSADYAAARLTSGPDGVRFDVLASGQLLGTVAIPLGGTHNVENALGVIAVARHLGLSFDEIRQGLATFAGVKRRQEARGEIGGVVVIDDFAHHPTAVRETVAAIRARYPDRPLWAVFEPRSNTSRRNIHQEEYASAFAGAARVRLKVPEPHDKVPADEQLDVIRLVKAIAGQGIDAGAARETAVLVTDVAGAAQPGDVVLVMSNGAFDGFVDRLLAALDARAPARTSA